MSCFATRKGMCQILRENDEVVTCKGTRPNCPFNKTKVQKIYAIKKVYKRLATLPKEQQTHISIKYYDGMKPWTECK